jgi:hypothetical protein
MRQVTVKCQSDGQAAVIAWCMEHSPNKDGIYQQDVPEKQGFFVHNTKSGQTYPVAKTGSDYTDFLYWTFSGRPPGVGESDSEDFEEPRWRSAAFAAVWGRMPKAQVAFKGRRAVTSTTTVDGIYITAVGPSSTPGITTVAETGLPASSIDSLCTSSSFIPITALGIERDGLRNGWLAFAASMANETDSCAGVYVTRTVK